MTRVVALENKTQYMSVVGTTTFFTATNVPSSHEKDLPLKACVWFAAMIDIVDAAAKLNAQGGKHQIRSDLHACILQTRRQVRFFSDSHNLTADDE